jgi:hypothetical protein
VKRFSLAAVAAGALAFAAVALGTAQHYKGTDSDAACGTVQDLDCTVKFSGKVVNGKVTKVKNFGYHGIPMACTEGNAALSNYSSTAANYPPPMTVKTHRKFSGHFQSTDHLQFVDITGKFSKNYKKASGTLQVHGDFASLHNCDTGVDAYSVSK